MGQRVLREDGTMVDGSPTVPARRLGRELKRLRDAIDKTQKEVADYCGTYPTTVSKIETGERNPPLSVLKLMLQLYEVDSEHTANLMQLAQEAREPGWWVDYSDDVPKWFTEYIREESAAREAWTYEGGYFPGLLQTRSYTEAITVAANTAETSESAERFAQVRAARQQRLTGKTPLVLRAVIDEAVLHRQVGGPEVMREQVARLRQAASQTNIAVQVLPFSVGVHPGLTGSFTVLRFHEQSMNMVYIEQRGGAVYLEGPGAVNLHQATFDSLSALALSEEDTTSLLSEMEGGY